VAAEYRQAGGGDRVAESYDKVAADYAARLLNELDYKPLDRALLSAVIEQTAAGAPIADVGCGPGHVTNWLRRHGATAVGVDLSSGMVDLARRTFPLVEFRQGDLRALPADDGEWGAAVALYSIIHLVPTELPVAFGELWRAIRPGGPLLVSFHAGDEIRHRDEWWGHVVSLDFRFLRVADVEAALVAAGFAIEARLERVNYPEETPTRRAYLLSRRLPAG